MPADPLKRVLAAWAVVTVLICTVVYARAPVPVPLLERPSEQFEDERPEREDDEGESDGHPPVYHYIVTRQGSSTIIAWSQCGSLGECQRDAAETLRYLTGSEKTPSLEFAEDDLDAIAM